jgi:hypothetical protein
MEKFPKNKGLADGRIQINEREMPAEILENWKISLWSAVLLLR